MKSLLEKNKNVFGKNVIAAKLSRRGFIKAGGILAVGIQFVGPELARGDAPPAPKHAPTPGNTLNPTLSGSWIEIHPDNMGHRTFARRRVTRARRCSILLLNSWAWRRTSSP